MRTIKENDKYGIYCPFNNKMSACVSCMALIEVEPEKCVSESPEFYCGLLYPPTNK